MKNSPRKKYVIAIIIFIVLLVLVICFGKGGYGIGIANKIVEIVNMDVTIAILFIVFFSLFIFKMYSNAHDWEKVVHETRMELIKTTCELADVSEELEKLKNKLSMIKEKHPEIDFEAEIAEMSQE